MTYGEDPEGQKMSWDTSSKRNGTSCITTLRMLAVVFPKNAGGKHNRSPPPSNARGSDDHNEGRRSNEGRCVVRRVRFPAAPRKISFPWRHPRVLQQEKQLRHLQLRLATWSIRSRTRTLGFTGWIAVQSQQKVRSIGFNAAIVMRKPMCALRYRTTPRNEKPA